jgi:hypothetical protein
MVGTACESSATPIGNARIPRYTPHAHPQAAIPKSPPEYLSTSKLPVRWQLRSCDLTGKPSHTDRQRSKPKIAPTALLVPCLPKQERRQVPRYTPLPNTKPFPSWRGSGVEVQSFLLSKNSATPTGTARNSQQARPAKEVRRASLPHRPALLEIPNKHARRKKCAGRACHTHRHRSLQATAQEDQPRKAPPGPRPCSV